MSMGGRATGYAYSSISATEHVISSTPLPLIPSILALPVCRWEAGWVGPTTCSSAQHSSQESQQRGCGPDRRAGSTPEASWRILNSSDKRSSTHPSFAWHQCSSPNPNPSWHLLSMTLGSLWLELCKAAMGQQDRLFCKCFLVCPSLYFL